MSKVIDFNLVECDKILFEKTSLLSYGYGPISQLPMKDREVSVAAKGVYAYLVSCAGNDKQTYPNKKTMMYDLNIRKESTLTNHIKQLQAKGYIKIVKTKRGNLKYKNVYLIATDTRTVEIWKNEFNNGEEMEEAKIVTENKGKITYQEIEKDIKVDENKKSLTCNEVKDNEVTTFGEVETTNNLKNSIDNDIIPQNDKMYTSNLKNNEKENEILNDDIETKNKKLMEQEKQFVPSFKMRWN